MTKGEVLIAVTIHLIIPIIGILFFLKLKNKMKEESIPNAPIIELFLIFTTYGGLLLVFLTALFWKWSGMASLGTFYLILVAPIIMGVVSYRARKYKIESKYYTLVYKLGFCYFGIAPATFLILFLIT